MKKTITGILKHSGRLNLAKGTICELADGLKEGKKNEQREIKGLKIWNPQIAKFILLKCTI